MGESGGGAAPNPKDRRAMSAPALLVDYGVTDDNADLLRPGPKMRKRCREMANRLRGEKILRAAGGLSPDEFRDALVAAARMMGGAP